LFVVNFCFLSEEETDMLTWMESLKGRSMMRLASFTDAEMCNLIELSAQLKERRRAGVRGDLLHRKNVALIFEKSSTRTRNSTLIAIRDEGGNGEYLTRPDIHFGKKESVKDTARVLGRIYDGILFRGFKQSDCEELARYSGVPVWNGLTDDYHPTQILADLLTVRENFGSLDANTCIAYVGDGRNNVANSLMVVCSKLGVNFAACGPVENQPEEWLVQTCKEIAAQNGSTVLVTDDVERACTGADAIYTDVWVSMGEPDEVWEQRIVSLSPYRVNAHVMELAGPDAIFLHCLPAYHDTKTAIGAKIADQFGITEMEVTDEVFESAQSRVFDEAENRMHAIKAIMYATLSDEPLSA
jgi:ornithine carbamoyltransferase